MFRTLMTSRRFAPLFWCQFFSAFNDNFVRNMLVMLILFRFGGEGGSIKILLAVDGLRPARRSRFRRLAARLPIRTTRRVIARRLKFAEIFVQAIAAAGFVLSSLSLLYVALFGLGCIAALFGPIKYGILPDHLQARGTRLRQRAGRGRDLRRDHLRPDRRRVRGGGGSLDRRRRAFS